LTDGAVLHACNGAAGDLPRCDAWWRGRRIRLNAAESGGPLPVEWEDDGMDREFGARESLEFVRRIDFALSDVAFGRDMKRRR
jgi:hypothetical protein